MKGAAGDAIYFHGDDSERCPDDQACRLQTYVIPRDEVRVSQAAGKFACSWLNLARAPRRLAESPRQRAFNLPAIPTNSLTARPERLVVLRPGRHDFRPDDGARYPITLRSSLQPRRRASHLVSCRGRDECQEAWGSLKAAWGWASRSRVRRSGSWGLWSCQDRCGP